LKNPLNIVVIVFCFLVVLSLAGCAPLLAIPAEIIGGTFKLLGQILQLVSRLPKPPPGVF
jgi:hypothetical protein